MNNSIPGLQLLHQGKVRNNHNIPDHSNLLLMIATDRISTHDVEHESTVSEKGYILTALTIFWMNKLMRQGINTHLVASGQKIFDYVPNLPKNLINRAIVVKKLKMIPIEFVIRSYLAGSLWSKYYSQGIDNPYGISLPKGLKLMSRFPQDIFTPTEKSATDDPTNSDKVINEYTAAYELSDLVYTLGQRHLLDVNLALVDAKFEIGIDCNGNPCLGDECFTLDSTRLTRPDSIIIGQNPSWLDKQLVRDKVEEIYPGGIGVQPMTFSDEILSTTTDTYHKVFEIITGQTLQEYWSSHMPS